MKKIAVASVLAFTMAFVAHATISINWLSSFGVDDPATPGTTFDLPIGSLVQLIWSTNATADAIDVYDPTTPQGDDILIDSLLTSSAGAFSSGGTYDAVVDQGWGEDAYVPGYVYLRVFNSGTPALNDWYGESSLVGGALTDQDPPVGQSPDVVDIASAALYTLPNQIIPEPTTIGLALTGIGFLLIRRYRKRK